MQKRNLTLQKKTSAYLASQISYVSLLIFYVFLMLLALVLDWGQFTQKPDTLIHDIWVRISGSEPPEDVVIIGIDSRSLQDIGRWPWSREVQAQLVKKLTQAEVRSLTLDILFTEPDSLNKENDLILSQAIAENRQAILPILTGEYSVGKINPESLPIPEITMVVAGLGHVYLPVDSDGIVRRVNLKSGFKSAHWSTLSLSLADVIGEAPEQLPGQRLDRGPIAFSWVSDYQVYIPFYGEGGSISTISASRVLNDELEKGELSGKHVFVGLTAAGLGDIQPTPVSSNANPVSGVEVHATIFSALREGRLVTRAEVSTGYIITGILLLLVLVLYSRLSPSFSLLGSLILILIPIIISFIFYHNFRLWYPPLSASIPVLVSFPLWSWHRLEFISRFMQSEIDAMDSDTPPVSSSDTLSLVSYLNSAMKHLPIKGWRMISNDMVFQNGDVISDKCPEKTSDLWQAKENNYCKLYPTSDKLFIHLNISEPEFADEITFMIDSLSRVRDREKVKNHLDAVERLQIKAQQFSLRIDNLRRMNTLSDSIFHGSPAGLAVWNMAGEFVRMNQLAYEMLPALLNKEPSFKSFISGLNRDPEFADAKIIRALLLDKEPWQIDFDVPGEERIIDFSVIGDRFADRLLVGSIVDVSSIRESKRAQAEMLEYISHDLRSPLISSVYLLSTQKEKSSDMDISGLDRIESNINLSLGMIDDLLNLARAENLNEDELKPILLDNVIYNSVDQLMPQALGKSISIRLHHAEDIDMWVNGNAVLLERAMNNIIGNAIKYSPEHTEIVVSTKVDGNFIVCEVIDQGIGMDTEKIAGMFERFKRDESVERGYHGTGLGLALVSRVIGQHHGQVWAESPVCGTKIIIKLPLLDL